MKETEYAILALFRNNPEIELSTSEIMQKIYSEDFSKLNEILEDSYSDTESRKKSKQEISKLHRRILHHLKKLNKDNIIKITKTLNKGQKKFSLNINEGEQIEIDKYKRRLVISKPNTPALPLADLEEKEIVFRVEPNHFFDRINCLLIEPSNFESLKQIYDFSYNLFQNVNDVIGINEFEKIIEKFNEEYVVETIMKLDEDAKAYNKRICCVINIQNIKDQIKALNVISKLLSHETFNINIVFDLNGRDMLDNGDFIKSIIEIFSLKKRKLNIKNNDVSPAPFLLGKAGPYCFSDNEWKNYKKTHQKTSKAIINTQSSIIIDVKKLYEKKPSAKQLKEAIIKCSHALHFANTFQRKNSEIYYKKLNMSEDMNNFEIFSYSKNYIRLWNFELFDNIQENFVFLHTLNELKQELINFSKIEETIYMSCGMPVNFKMALSLAYRRFREGFSLQQDFDWIIVNKIEDIYSDENKEKLTYYEKVNKILEGGFEVRLLRKGNVDSIDILREMHLLTNSYKLPLICYNFSENVGSNMKLNNFI